MDWEEGNSRQAIPSAALADAAQPEQGNVLRRAAVEGLAIVSKFCEFALAVGEETLLVERVKVVHV